MVQPNQIRLEDWQTGKPIYEGVDTNRVLVNFLDDPIAEDRKTLLSDGTVAHLHEAWVFWQFLSIAVGDASGFPVFGRMEYAPIVLHLAKILRANDLAKALEKNLEALSLIPDTVVRDYISGTGDVKRKHPDFYQDLAVLIDTGYDQLVRLGEVEGAVGARPQGDSDNELKNALASYLEEIRKGALTPKPLPLTALMREGLEEEVEEEAKRRKEHEAYRAKLKPLQEKHLAQGHSEGIVENCVFGRSKHIRPFLDVVAERGFFLKSGLLPEVDWERRCEVESGSWPTLQEEYFKASDGRIVVVLGFLDAYVLVDLKSMREWARTERIDTNQHAGDKRIFLRLSDKPKISIHPATLKVRFPKWYNWFSRTVKYTI